MQTDAVTAASLVQRRRDALARLLAAEGLDSGVERAIVPRDPAAEVPLSFAQEVLWLLDRATPGLTAYNSPAAARVLGPLDLTALASAATALVARHEALRTAFDAVDERAVQFPLPPSPVTVLQFDACALPAERRTAAALEFLRKIADTPFDLAAGTPLRIAVAHVAVDEHLLLLLTHHIVSDAWSYGIIFSELATLYDAELRGAAADLPPVRLQFGDYAVWQRAHMRGDELERRIAYWRERLASLAVLELPLDRVAGTSSSLAGGRRTRRLPGVLLRDLQRLARERGTTLYAVLLAALQTVLHRYTGQTDIVVGSAVAGRTPSETEGIVGYFSQALPMRARFDGDATFAEVLGRVSDAVLGAVEHQDVPFEPLALELQRAGRPNDAPLFRVVLTMQNARTADLRFGAATLEPIEVDAGATKFDLTLLGTELRDGLDLSLWYRSDVYEAATAERLLGHLERLLGEAAADPARPVGALPLLTVAETAQLDAWNATERSVGFVPLHERFVAAAGRTPAAMAVACGPQRMTYAELEARSRAVALRLRSLGVARGVPVGLVFERSCGFVVALLGTLRAGGHYVPLAADLPADRLAAQLAQCGAPVVVTEARFAASAPADAGRVVVLDALFADDPGAAAVMAALPPAGIEPDDLAYVLFTSGSTGTPKGVAVTHGNVANYAAAIVARLELDGPPLQYAAVSSPAADLGNTAIFTAVCTGGGLHMIPVDVASDPVRFGEYVSAERIDVLKVTPSHLRALLEAPSEAAALPRQRLVLGGEACGWDLVRRVRRAGSCRVFNHYGPTETTVGACAFEAVDDALAVNAATVPIGKPLANVRCYVLDARRQPVPVGIAGELYVGGAGVAAGYAGAPELSVERFVPDPWVLGAKMYRTGDRVRRLVSGDLEFLGRADDQVKVRGFRVELGEIENALTAHPHLSQAAVALCEAGGDAARIAAYVVPASGPGSAPPDEAAMRAFLAERLPDYMLPATYEILERLPLTANGKLDRAALAARRPAESTATVAPGFVAPRTPTEAAIAAVWAEVLRVERVSVTADFLALGFHSILAIRALGKLSRVLGVRLPLRALFDAPTIERLASVVSEASTGRTSS